MNFTKTGTVALVGLAGIFAANAQTTLFGTYTSPSQTPESFPVSLPPGTTSLNFSATFGASVTFTPVTLNPVAGSEDFTVTYSAVTLTLSSLNGYLATDPLTLTLGPVSQVVTVPYPYSQTTVNFTPAVGQVSDAFNRVFAPNTTDTLIVTWTVLGGPTVTGGKGAIINSDIESLHGSIGLVPETADFVAPGILAMAGFAVWNTRRRRAARANRG